MTADIASLVIEPMRAIRADLAELKSHGASANFQLASMSQQLGALTTAVYGGHSERADLRRRVARRLELVDD